MSSELPPLPSPAWRPAVSRAVHRRGPAPPWRQQTVVPLRPTRRFNRRRQAVIAGLGFMVCLGLFCWASFWLWPPSGACIILLGAGYEDNLAIPHNAYGRRSLNDLLEVSSSPNTAFFWGSRQLRLKHEPRELHVGDDWNAGWTDFPEKTLVVYLACHGAVDDQGAYLLPQDAGTRPEDRLRLTAILDRLAALPADKNKVLILDATQVTAHGPLGLLHNDFARELDRLDDRITAMPNLVVLSASDAEQRSWGCPEWRRTIFAHYVIEGLKGAAADDDRDGLIDAWELHQFVRSSVERWVRDNRAAARTPVLLPRGPLGQRRAVRAQLTMTRSYEPPDPQQTPPFDPPSQLVKGWENFGRLERQVPSLAVYTPHIWRQYQDTLLRCEQLVRAGDREHAELLFGRLGDLEQEMSRARYLQLNCVQYSLPMPAAAGAGVPSIETLAARFHELSEAPPQEYAARWNGLQASNPATGPRDQQFLRLQFSDFLLQRGAEDPERTWKKRSISSASLAIRLILAQPKSIFY